MTDHQQTQHDSGVTESVEDLRGACVQMALFASESSDEELAMAAATVADLLTIASLFADDPTTHERSEEILEFCRHEALPTMTDSAGEDSIQNVRLQIESRFDESLSLLAPEERFINQDNVRWTDPNSGECSSLQAGGSADSAAIDEIEQSVPIDVESILASLANATDSPGESDNLPASAAAGQTAENSPLPQPPREVESIDDPEMVAAFADDAQQCLAEMEASLLSLETGQAGDEPLRNFCRQLHTLKGASGTVGLARLARYLHDLESYVEAASDQNIDVDRLLEGVDAVRAQLDAPGLSGSSQFICPASAVATENREDSVPAPIQSAVTSTTDTSRRNNHAAGKSPVSSIPSAGASATGSDGELFVRVEASRLERLMDLLAELVMLRNRRDSYVDSLRSIHGELNHCASRAHALTSSVELSSPSAAAIDSSATAHINGQTAATRLLTRSLDEVSKDTTELSRSLEEVCEPLSDDNSAVSHLIGRFRQELMEMRRVPIGGLFQRLQRAIRDAAKAEGKQVEINFEGQGARADRAVQERLFEPLLHLVRNAVSHGIQTADDRIRSGKPAAGRITLAAWSDATALRIEVRDDGQGLNEEALESRGRELGLLPVGETVSRNQLRNLIFHPGFSTKTSVSEVSGRGVGMDVVDSWVRRLRGRIDVESMAGQGTTFRLQIPLRSAVEHAMVIRAAGQLFALPMHTVSGTSDSRVPLSGLTGVTTDAHAVPLSRIVGARHRQITRGCHVTLRDPAQDSHGRQKEHDGDITIAVDAVVGVEEVVVRSLPPLLQRNELFAGVTLSGRAETVLLLDVGRLIELSRAANNAPQAAVNGVTTDRIPNESHGSHGSDEQFRILIVDDSVTVRRSLSKRLQPLGYDTLEARNGREALDVLTTGGIKAVVTDIDMPGMNGVELLQEIKRQKHLQQLPVTVLTSRDEESMPQELRHLQPTAIISKPVTDGTVAAIVESFSSTDCPGL